MFNLRARWASQPLGLDKTRHAASPRGREVGWDGARDPAEDPAGTHNEVQDAVPPEWIPKVERAEAERQARRHRRLVLISWLAPGLVFCVVGVALAVLFS
jgi:hypothetical protein